VQAINGVDRQQTLFLSDHRAGGIHECLCVHLGEAYAKAPHERMGYYPTVDEGFQPLIRADKR
jgi:hypothetical protein